MPTSANTPNSHPAIQWLSQFTCPALVIVAAVMAFPWLIGSKDDPAYPLAAAILFSAVVVGIRDYAGGFGRHTSERRRIVLAANEYAAGTITLEEYGSQTKEILNDS